jgi:hypothetical protein
VLIIALGALGYIGVKLCQLRRERQNEKRSALIEEGDFEEDDDEANSVKRKEVGSFASASVGEEDSGEDE